MEIERMSSVEKNIGEGEEDEDVALPGFRFHPTDEELVGFYLRRKVEKKRLSIDIINQVDIYKFDPWDLAKQSTVSVGENKWYFFCLRGRKYRNSVRPNRVTRSGYWKATGIDKKIIFPPGTNNCIGLKKCLVYYCGKGGKGTKTYWMMHEFRLPPKGNELSDNSKTINADDAHEVENWTICRIFQRDPSSLKKSPSQSIPIPADDAKSMSWVVESSDSADQILEELFATSVSPRGEVVQVEQEQVLNDCAEEQKCSSSSVFDELLSENPDSTVVLPDAFDDFGDTTWEELAKFL